MSIKINPKLVRSTTTPAGKFYFVSDIENHYDGLLTAADRAHVTYAGVKHEGNFQRRRLIPASLFDAKPKAPKALMVVKAPPIAFFGEGEKVKAARTFPQIGLHKPSGKKHVVINVKQGPQNITEAKAAVRPIEEIKNDVNSKEVSDLCEAYTRHFIEKFGITAQQLRDSNNYEYREPRYILYTEFNRLYKHDPRVKSIPTFSSDAKTGKPYIQHVKDIGMLPQLALLARAIFSEYKK